jgi:hypothetical protein
MFISWYTPSPETHVISEHVPLSTTTQNAQYFITHLSVAKCLANISRRFVVSLCSQDLKVVSPESQTLAFPRSEVICSCDSAATSWRGANRFDLKKGRGAFNRWLVGASVGVDVVSSSITCDRAYRVTRRSLVVVFDDVIFDKRICGPSVHGKSYSA